MKRNNIVLKSISYLILVVMLYMHVCSALCATGFGGCCDNNIKTRGHITKSCCSHKEEGNTKDCQGFHLSFFNTTGQFTPDQCNCEINALQCLFVVPFVDFNTLHVLQNKVVFAYNIFHPPNLNPDIRIIIQSFQI